MGHFVYFVNNVPLNVPQKRYNAFPLTGLGFYVIGFFRCVFSS
ncbi:hypothetical protein D3OALGA1CA_2387 [Olavius algarvensis associated proteobacterium Delta 3]|nr:hypothetical protein D3OALGB2SA_290 [Olavius algarvensis associated proteobacterium Delta 3]CAB5117769.1 hypothetical protein D3OALGA1CA_2387 [Olavius algarvensis associated proteobacterium Delta 3]